VAGIPELSESPHAVMLVINASNINLQDKNMERAFLIDFEFLDLKLRNELFPGNRIARAAFSRVKM